MRGLRKNMLTKVQARKEISLLGLKCSRKFCEEKAVSFFNAQPLCKECFDREKNPDTYPRFRRVNTRPKITLQIPNKEEFKEKIQDMKKKFDDLIPKT